LWNRTSYLHNFNDKDKISLFQQTIIEKYFQSVNHDKIHSAFQLFSSTFLNPAIQENIRNSKEEQYQEGFLRDLFVNILGYTLNPAEDYNLTTEYTCAWILCRTNISMNSYLITDCLKTTFADKDQKNQLH